MTGNKESLCEIRGTIKRNNLCIIGVWQEREKGAESLLKERIKNKTQLYAAYKRFISHLNTHRLNGKRI